MHFNNGPKKKGSIRFPHRVCLFWKKSFTNSRNKEKHKSECCVNKAFTNVRFLSLAKPLIVASIPRSTVLSQPKQHICTT